jgi:Rrf2 family transcriptional regulator, cysteine metabolism repressor
MRLSNTDIYAFKALAFLGSRQQDGEQPRWLHGDEIALATAVPKSYLVRLLAALVGQGIVLGRKGTGGGYALARPAAQISLTEVMRAMDGPVAALSCASHKWPKTCPEQGRCQVRSRVWLRVRDAILAVLEETSVADLVADAEAGVDYRHCLEHLLRPSDFGVGRAR